MSADPEFMAPARHAPKLLDEQPELRVGRHLLLFFATVVSVFYAGALYASTEELAAPFQGFFRLEFLAQGASFAIPLLAILVTHEFGHYFAARYHGVPASLPYFLPLPGLGVGTLGAVIAMRGPIRSRSALLDVGASGPIAGLCVAIPVLAWGLLNSRVLANPASGYSQEGQSLLYLVLKRVFVGPIPEAHDVYLHPTAYAGWVGLFLTMINLLPWGQLDGGHIAYALLGRRQHDYARWFRRALLLLFAYNATRFIVPVLLGRSQLPLELAILNSTFWLMWFVVLGVLARVSGGAEHPPFEHGELSGGRKAVGWLCLVLFVLLFMPTPMAVYVG